jgi:hypothetical protein
VPDDTTSEETLPRRSGGISRSFQQSISRAFSIDLALHFTTAVTTNDGPSFGVETARTPSMRIRLGARYRY